MYTFWGILIFILGLIAWAGQIISAISPQLAAQLGITETESEVDPAFHADIRAEAFWDSIVLWTFPLAGILLALNNLFWVYFGLIGGSIYLYYSGRGIMQRIFMSRKNIKIGTPTNIKAAYMFCSLWGISGIITIILSFNQLIE
jgi:hypothetical protein